MKTKHYVSPAKLKILVVEDHLVFSRAVKAALRDQEVIVARSAEEALDSYKQQLPDITLLDINLPDGSGHDVLQQLLQFDSEAFVVMLTGSGLQEDIMRAVKNGAKGYILKPFTKRKMEKYIEQYYAHRDALEEILLQQATASNGPRLVRNIAAETIAANAAGKENLLKEQMQKVRILFVDDFEANRHNVHQELTKLGYNIDIAPNGQDALDMVQETDYALIFMDCEMDGSDGYQITSRIRHYDRIHKKHRVIIGMGEAARDDKGQRWLRAGMNDYIRKPTPVKKLHETLLKYWEQLFEEYTRD